MTIGFSVQGSTDRALLHGLRTRWCPNAGLIQGPFRGSTQESLRREYRKICEQFVEQNVEVMVFLTDADTEPWREVQRNERSRFPAEHLPHAVHGVADRNVECWICADPQWLARELGAGPEQFQCENPKRAFERVLGISRDDSKEAEIAALVSKAPLHRWLIEPSFEDLYEQLRDQSQQLGCCVENLRDSGAASRRPDGGS